MNLLNAHPKPISAIDAPQEHISLVALLFGLTTLSMLAFAGYALNEAYLMRYAAASNFVDALRLCLLGVAVLGLAIVVGLVGLMEIAARSRRFAPGSR
jgi:hypothetical protein